MQRVQPENCTVVRALLADLRERGLDTEDLGSLLSSACLIPLYWSILAGLARTTG